MLTSKDLRTKAWNSLKGKYWIAFAVSLVAGFLATIGDSMVTTAQELIDIVSKVDPSEMDAVMKIGALAITGAALVISIVGLIVSIFVGGAATVGLGNFFIRNTDSAPTFGDAFRGFKVRYGRNTGVLLWAAVKATLWTFLFIIPGIIKIYEYAIIPYILADDDTISSKEAFKKAKEMMRGNKWRLFKLNFSFIGWALLSALTLGIGALFLAPYIEAANAEFYAELKNKENI